MLASDQGNPAQTATVVAKLEILRNFQEPKFDPRNYNTEILETHGLGVSIVQVRARDTDTKVIKCNKGSWSVECFLWLG